MTSKKSASTFVLISALMLGIIFGVGNIILAYSPGPGYDLFETSPGAQVDMTAYGLGIVPLKGVAMGPGSTDTIVERKPPGGLGIVDIELVALHLKSIDPVDLTPVGGPPLADMHITINRRPTIFPNLPMPVECGLSIGSMEIRHENLDSDVTQGTFDSCFGDTVDCSLGVPGGGIYANAIFTIVDGDPNDPVDVLFSTCAPKVVLVGHGTWIHTRPEDDVRTPDFPAGEFYIGSIIHDSTGAGHHPVIVTLITLSSFNAKQKGKIVIIKWETATEIDNLGFNIYRSESENGEYVKINKKLITAKGSSIHGASYKFVDEKVKSGKAYWYKLEDIDSGKGPTQHGPAKAEVSGSKKKGRK